MVGVDRGSNVEWDAAIDGFASHIRDERRRSEHTVRAYLMDIRHLRDFCIERGVDSPSKLDLAVLRAWLAAGTAGYVTGRSGDTTRSRAFLARKAVACRLAA